MRAIHASMPLRALQIEAQAVCPSAGRLKSMNLMSVRLHDRSLASMATAIHKA